MEGLYSTPTQYRSNSKQDRRLLVLWDLCSNQLAKLFRIKQRNDKTANSSSYLCRTDRAYKNKQAELLRDFAIKHLWVNLSFILEKSLGYYEQNRH